MTDLQPARGTHDLIGEDQRRHHHVVETARAISGRYGFEEWATPIFEDTRVFSRTLGETSDVVTKEMYTFDDRGGDSITLRPEGTAGVCRALVTNGLTQSLPKKVFYAGPMFRYERPQKGRYRQFHQIGMELIGPSEPLSTADLGRLLQKRSPAYDKDREEHYNLISALHKSIRGSDPDAALYWLARMLDGGEDPLFIARRLIRAASEDIGEADPLSLLLANAAKDTYDFLGSPEGELALAQLCVHLATAPKSNSVYIAFGRARRAAKETGSLMPPAHIRNAPTKLMKTLGYGEGYAYDHDAEEGFSGQNYFPEGMARPTFYTPKGEGVEARVKERLDRWAALRAERGG